MWPYVVQDLATTQHNKTKTDQIDKNTHRVEVELKSELHLYLHLRFCLCLCLLLYLSPHLRLHQHLHAPSLSGWVFGCLALLLFGCLAVAAKVFCNLTGTQKASARGLGCGCGSI